MSTTTAPPTTQTYYDRFSTTYEAQRHHGYHRLIDELELQLIRRYGEGRDVFEAGCGTGLLLRETARSARSAVGLDLSRGMLRAAHGRMEITGVGPELMDQLERTGFIDVIGRDAVFAAETVVTASTEEAVESAERWLAEHPETGSPAPVTQGAGQRADAAPHG